MKADYDTTLARIAGNIAAGLVRETPCMSDHVLVQTAVTLAEMVVVEVRDREAERAAAAVQPEGPHP